MFNARQAHHRTVLVRTATSFLVAAGLLTGSAASLRAQARSTSAGASRALAAGTAYGIPEAYRPLETAAESRAAKVKLRPGEGKLNSILRQRLHLLELEGLATGGMRVLASRYSTPEVPIDEQGRLLVELQVKDEAPYVNGYIESIGGSVKQIARGYGFLTAWVPADRLLELAERPDVKVVRHVELVKTDLGTRQSEGDAIHNADDARACFGVNGSGVTVGVISDGVDNLSASQNAGDLPAVGLPGATGSGDEGTAMLEIVADLAPSAALNFASGSGGTTAMILAIASLALTSGMDVITDDLANPQEPLFEDGPIAQIKQAVWNLGIFYTCSAGNRANQHYQGNYAGLGARSFGPEDYENVHDFGGGDFRLNVTLNNGNNDLYLQWAEPFGAADIDIDVFIVDGSGNILASSTGGQNGGDDPAETISFNSSGGSASIILDYVDGGAAPGVFVDLRSFNITFDQFVVPQGSINGASRQNELYAAGAANASASTTVTSYSSKGPINHFFPASLTRMKPDGVGIDGVTVTGAGCFGCGNSCPPIPATCTFFGTSAATPHVAGLAALLLDWDGSLTPDEIKTAFNNTATDIDAPGVDNNAGAGLLDVKAAICSLDNEAPAITGYINGGSVNANCSVTIPFHAKITDNGCVSTANVQYSVTVPGGNATVGTVSASVTADGDSAVVDGTAVIRDLTSCPAVVRFEVNATDDCGNGATPLVATANVVDDTKPSVTCPNDITVECSSHCGTPKDDPQLTDFFAAFTATDNCDDDPLLSNDALDCFDLGTTTVTFSAEDNCDNVESCTADITVVDTTPPEITVSLNRDTLWPPNHKMAAISATVEVTDICDPMPTFVLYSITSDEPDNGTGDGDTPNDIQEADVNMPDVEFLLRSERAGTGDGRKYTITYRAMDMSGNTADSTVCVYVPHDQSGHAQAAAGYLPTGAALDLSQSLFTMVVPSKPNFDARTVSGWTAAVGNSIDAFRPKRFAYRDRNGDGRPDLELTFEVQPVQGLRGQSTKKDPIGLHYWGADGQGYLVDDIFRLGAPLTELEVADGSHNDGGPADDGLDVELPGDPDQPAGEGEPGFDVSGRLVLTEAGPATIEVFNVLGRRIRTLSTGDLTPGAHDVAWDGRDESGQSVSAGLYFIRVRAPEGVFTRKVRLDR